MRESDSDVKERGAGTNTDPGIPAVGGGFRAADPWEMERPRPRVLARGANPDKATLIATLLSLGLWDFVSIADREAWCERAEIMDTPGGRRLFDALKRLGAF